MDDPDDLLIRLAAKLAHLSSDCGKGLHDFFPLLAAQRERPWVLHIPPNQHTFLFMHVPVAIAWTSRMITVLSASAARSGTERNHIAAKFTQRPTAIINKSAFVVWSVMIALLPASKARLRGNVTAAVDLDAHPIRRTG